MLDKAFVYKRRKSKFGVEILQIKDCEGLQINGIRGELIMHQCNKHHIGNVFIACIWYSIPVVVSRWM